MGVAIVIVVTIIIVLGIVCYRNKVSQCSYVTLIDNSILIYRNKRFLSQSASRLQQENLKNIDGKRVALLILTLMMLLGKCKVYIRTYIPVNIHFDTVYQ